MFIRLKKNRSGKFYWELVGENGEVLAHSEEYSSHAKALQTPKLIAMAISDCVVKEGSKIVFDPWGGL